MLTVKGTYNGSTIPRIYILPFYWVYAYASSATEIGFTFSIEAKILEEVDMQFIHVQLYIPYVA